MGKDRWGFINKSGKVIIQQRYENVGNFSEGLAAVMENSKWGFVDKSGKVVIQQRYESVGNFREGLAAVKEGGKWGFVNRQGHIVIQSQFTNVESFSEGLAAVKEGGKWGFINGQGHIVIKPQFDKVGKIIRFTEGLASVKVNKKCGFIDKSGRIAISPAFDSATEFHEGLAATTDSRGYITYIDRSGKTAIKIDSRPLAGGWAGPFSKEGMAMICFDQHKIAFSECGFINRQGVFVIKPNLEINPF